MTRAGIVISLPDVVLAEAIGGAYDLAWLDLEHGALAARDVAPLAIALRAAGCETHVRLASVGGDELARAIDAGADGVVVPGVDSARELAPLLVRLHYPPAGRRGYGPRRAGRYGRDGGFPSRPACTVQVETPAAVASVTDLATTDGVDALVVGCADLAVALLERVTLESATLRDAVRTVERAARAAGVGFGLAGGGDPRALAALAERPPDLLVHSVDVRLVASAADAAAARLRALEEEAACR